MDAEQWLEGHVVDEDKAHQFLELSPERQQIIILKGPLQGCRDPTAVLVSRLNALPPDPEAAKAPRGEFQGKVKSYSVFKGFGFIFPETDDDPDIFLHFKSVVDGSVPAAGDTVTFDLESADTNVENQMKAVNIRGGTGYPLTADQKGKDKDKAKGKGCSGSQMGKADYGPCGKDSCGGSYGKGYGGGKMMGMGYSPYGCGMEWSPYGCGMEWSPYGCGKGYDCGPGWDCGKGWGGCCYMPVMKGPPCGKGKGRDFGKGCWDGGKMAMGGKMGGKGYGYGW